MIWKCVFVVGEKKKAERAVVAVRGVESETALVAAT
jgi:hypothetical protein